MKRLLLTAIATLIFTFSALSYNIPTKNTPDAESYSPMVVEGRIWWYYDKYNVMDYSAEAGFRIGEKVEIDGVEWHKIIKILSRDAMDRNYNDGTYRLVYDAEPAVTAYIREENKRVYAMMDDNCQPYYQFECCGIPLWGSIEKGVQSYLFGNVGDTFNIGSEGETVEYIIESITDFEEGGFTSKLYKAVPTATQYSNNDIIRYIESLGCYKNGSPFWLALTSPCATLPGYRPPMLRYVTEGDDNRIIYTGEGGTKLWEEYASAETIVPDNSGSETCWFNFQGQQIPQPSQPGIYLRRNAGKVEKIIIQ